MAELEEKLNAILGDPNAMGQIMALARSLQFFSRLSPICISLGSTWPSRADKSGTSG